MFALVFGVIYVVVGILGFFVAATPFVGETGKNLIVFELNGLHNLAHILVGALLLAGSRTAASARSVNILVGAVYLLLAILGFAGVLVQDLLSVNAADNVLHLVTAVLALYFGLATGPRTATA